MLLVACDSAEEETEVAEEVESKETTQIENINVTVKKEQINQLEVNEELAISLDGYEVGDTVENLVIEYIIEKATDTSRNLFVYQSAMVTNTGQQIKPKMLLADNITSSMLGAVECIGSVPHLMEEGVGEYIEWVEVNLPAMLDGESYDRVSDETKITIEF